MSGLSELLWERDAELAYSKMAEIETAAAWCRRNGPHRLEFLNQIRKILMAEEIQLAKAGLNGALRSGAIKPTQTLMLLTPSQALRLLECYKRATMDNPAIWRASDLAEMHKIEADLKRDTTIADLRRQFRLKNNGNTRTDSAGDQESTN